MLSNTITVDFSCSELSRIRDKYLNLIPISFFVICSSACFHEELIETYELDSDNYLQAIFNPASDTIVAYYRNSNLENPELLTISITMQSGEETIEKTLYYDTLDSQPKHGVFIPFLRFTGKGFQSSEKSIMYNLEVKKPDGEVICSGSTISPSESINQINISKPVFNQDDNSYYSSLYWDYTRLKEIVFISYNNEWSPTGISTNTIYWIDVLDSTEFFSINSSYKDSLQIKVLTFDENTSLIYEMIEDFYDIEVAISTDDNMETFNVIPPNLTNLDGNIEGIFGTFFSFDTTYIP